jgi:hypothetical protein
MERLRQLAAHRGRYVLITLAALKRRCELQKMSGEEVIPTMMKILRLENASVLEAAFLERSGRLMGLAD